MKEEFVVLVNQNDEQIGLMAKLEAHEKALLHRAFSVFVLNEKNEIYLSYAYYDCYGVFTTPNNDKGYFNLDGEFIINPTTEETEKSDIDLTVAGTKEAINMVESSAKEVKEDDEDKAPGLDVHLTGEYRKIQGTVWANNL